MISSNPLILLFIQYLSPFSSHSLFERQKCYFWKVSVQKIIIPNFSSDHWNLQFSLIHIISSETFFPSLTLIILSKKKRMFQAITISIFNKKINHLNPSYLSNSNLQKSPLTSYPLPIPLISITSNSSRPIPPSYPHQVFPFASFVTQNPTKKSFRLSIKNRKN